jgi:integrase
MQWVPLIGLYSGMRANEICQLTAADIGQDAGIPFFNVREGDGKSVKTGRVPAAHLIRLPLKSATVRDDTGGARKRGLWTRLAKDI